MTRRCSDEVTRLRGWAPVTVGAALAIGLLIAGCRVTGPAPQPPADSEQASEDVLARLKDAVVMVEVALTTPGGGQTSSGSGFVIKDDGHIITNAHVVTYETQREDGTTETASDREVQVVFHPGTEDEEVYDAEVERENREVDLALLKIDRETPVYLTPAGAEDVTETMKVFAAGHPLGLREISIRTGTVTAFRTWEGREYVEHDASAEEGSSGGPVVDAEGRVVGVHVQTLASRGMMTKFAIPAQVLKDWILGDPSEDPAPPTPGAPVRELLVAADLQHEEVIAGTFSVPYVNGVTVFVHEYEGFLRVFARLGEMPGADELMQGRYAVDALRFNYSDPVGRLSLNVTDGSRRLFWETQIPIGAATPEYLDTICLVGANQVARWDRIVSGESPPAPDDLYPGGDKEALLGRLEQSIKAADLGYETDGKRFTLPYENDVTVRATIYRGMVYTYCYTGGMPGADEGEQGEMALALLARNWSDPFGRLSLDKEFDLAWESQVPMDFVTPDYFAVLAGTCARQVGDFWEEYGKIAFNAE